MQIANSENFIALLEQTMQYAMILYMFSQIKRGLISI